MRKLTTMLFMLFLAIALVIPMAAWADDDGRRLDFGFIVSTLSSDTGTGILQGFITTTIRAERGRVFRGAQSFGPSGPIPTAPEDDVTFEWVASRRRKGSARSDTLLQLSNLDTNATITIDRQYFDQNGVDCTRVGLGSIFLGPEESVMIHVSEELKPVCSP